jgi:hypothetical protein
VRGFSAIEAGFAFLPMTALIFAMSRVVPWLAPRFGTARLLIGGLVVDLIGLGWLSRVSAGTNYFPGIAIPLLFLGVGAGIAFITLTGRGLAGVPDSDAGAASGLVNVFHQVGGCLGIAIMTTVFVSATRTAGPAPAGHVLAHGVSAALTGATVSLVLALVVTLVTVRPRKTAAVVSASADQPDVVDALAA